MGMSARKCRMREPQLQSSARGAVRATNRWEGSTMLMHSSTSILPHYTASHHIISYHGQRRRERGTDPKERKEGMANTPTRMVMAHSALP